MQKRSLSRGDGAEARQGGGRASAGAAESRLRSWGSSAKNPTCGNYAYQCWSELLQFVQGQGWQG
eukprot:13937183-Alexandrium_andersonii.AAC.1